jgi:hypothetical protein
VLEIYRCTWSLPKVSEVWFFYQHWRWKCNVDTDFYIDTGSFLGFCFSVWVSLKLPSSLYFSLNQWPAVWVCLFPRSDYFGTGCVICLLIFHTWCGGVVFPGSQVNTSTPCSQLQSLDWEDSLSHTCVCVIHMYMCETKNTFFPSMYNENIFNLFFFFQWCDCSLALNVALRYKGVSSWPLHTCTQYLDHIHPTPPSPWLKSFKALCRVLRPCWHCPSNLLLSPSPSRWHLLPNRAVYIPVAHL